MVVDVNQIKCSFADNQDIIQTLSRFKKNSNNIINMLFTFRIDIKNEGNSHNSIRVSADTCKVQFPKWLNDENGQGAVIEGTEQRSIIKLNVIQDGILKLCFRGKDKKNDNDRIPLWIDYKSIKIDGKEILSSIITTWYRKPYRYEMPVKNGQDIILEIEQQYHQYNENELIDLLFKLRSDKNNTKNLLSKEIDDRPSPNVKIYAPDNYFSIKSSYKLSDTLSYEVVKDGICIPPSNESWTNRYDKYLSLGYVLDSDKKYVLVGGMDKQKIYTRSDISLNIEYKKSIHKKAIYLGCFIGQYGHFLCQGLSRLWFLLNNDYKDYDLIYTTIENKVELPDFVGKILSLFGLELSKLTRITEATQYNEIIVPEISFALNKFWAQEYKNTIDKIKESIKPVKNHKIYLSRCHFKDNIIGEKSIEKTFAENGYKIIYPEELSPEEQIALISGADNIVTSTGTTAHNLIFARDGTKCTILERGIRPNKTQPMINEMRNLDSSYIMANYSILPVSVGRGPYILGINSYMQKFFHDNNITYNKELEHEYIQYLITYQYLWYSTYSNPRFYNDLKKQNTNIPEDYIQTAMKTFKNIFDGKEIQIISDKNLKLR